MTPDTTFAWIGLLVLGAIHGINPAMGWLFAVSLGLQEERRGAVWAALGPLALGHAGAVVAAVTFAALIGQWIPLRLLRWIVAALLVGFGVAHLTRHRHPVLGGMRVGARELTVWSFLMASAHGAGLMVLPFVLGAGPAGSGTADATVDHASHLALPAAAGVAPPWVTGLLGSLAHTAGYLLVTGLVAVAVYEWLGLRLLRTAWLNLNVLWAGALVVTGFLTLVL